MALLGIVMIETSTLAASKKASQAGCLAMWGLPLTNHQLVQNVETKGAYDENTSFS